VNPNPEIPEELARAEKSELMLVRTQSIQRRLLARRPPDDQPLVTLLVSTTERGVITFGLPSGERCLPVFTSASHAADYRRVLLPNGPPNQYLVSSASQFLVVLRDVERIGVHQFAVNRCPRCDVVSAFDSRRIQSENDVITVCAIHLATETARIETYLFHALKEARAGELAVARDIALSAAGHVTLDEPMLHLLIGEVAVGLNDRTLLSEAKAFLGALHREPLTRMLEQAEKAGAPDFSVVVAPMQP
jgi:hypothetical protein